MPASGSSTSARPGIGLRDDTCSASGVDDFEDAYELAKIARVTGLSLDEFRQEFEYLIGAEPPQLRLDLQRGFVPDEAAPPVDSEGKDDRPVPADP